MVKSANRPVENNGRQIQVKLCEAGESFVCFGTPKTFLTEEGFRPVIQLEKEE